MSWSLIVVRGGAICILLASAVALAGCSQGDELTPVQGKLFIGDAPATKGMGYVTFHPDDKKGNTSLEEAVGSIKPDGTYTLETRGKSGVAKGWYKVGVSLAEVMDPNNPYVTKWLMPEPDKYQDWNQSGISIEVVESPAEGQYDIKLPALDKPPEVTGAPSTP
jgi:hypothetical protein